jgi:GNAT superfamily N-acetyltransferase
VTVIPEVWGRTETLAHADALCHAYAEVFAPPPWSRDPTIAYHSFHQRLENDVERPGFRATVSISDGNILGFSTGWITQAPFPTSRSYPRVADKLGPDRVDNLLIGAFEVDEMAVRHAAHGKGLGRGLLAAITDAAPDGRAWLLTWDQAPDAVAFYRHIGWHEVPPLPGIRNEVVIFLSPKHPGA